MSILDQQQPSKTLLTMLSHLDSHRPSAKFTNSLNSSILEAPKEYEEMLRNYEQNIRNFVKTE